mgnify:FL=1
MHIHRPTTQALKALAVASVLACSGAASAADAPYAPVTDARLKAAASDSGWLMYRRDYTSRGYAPFKTIDTGNVANLKPAWDWKSELHGP